jgi:1,4-dihydroxy-2-naphthoate octaprenyltransferase
MNPPSISLAANWLMLLPYMFTGLVPFGVGTLLAGACGLPLHPGVFLAGLAAAAALILAAAASRGAFPPGAGLGLDQGWLDPRRARLLARGLVVLAALVVAVLQFSGQSGDWTIPLGGLGILGGYFFFAPPIRWHQRGLGEAVGALGFGLLPVTAGFYLQTGHLVTEILLYGLPLSFGAFNLFLVQGFPPPGESEGERFTLAERLGPVAGALVYTLANILTMVGLGFCLFFPAAPLPSRNWLWPLLLLAVVNQELVKRRVYLKEEWLRLLCGLTLGLHLGMGLTFALGLWLRL